MATPYAEAMNLVNASASLTASNINIASQASLGSGIFLSGSSLVVQSSNISLVNASSTSPVGISLTNNSLLTLADTSLNVTNTGSSANAIAIQVQGNSTAVINNTDIAVNSVNQQTSVGFFIADTVSDIEMKGGSLTVVGTANSTLSINFAPPENVVFSGVSCRLNGSIVVNSG